MKLLVNRHVFSLMGAVIGVLISLILIHPFPDTQLFQFIDGKTKIITDDLILNLTTIGGVIGFCLGFLHLICVKHVGDSVWCLMGMFLIPPFSSIIMCLIWMLISPYFGIIWNLDCISEEGLWGKHLTDEAGFILALLGFILAGILITISLAGILPEPPSIESALLILSLYLYGLIAGFYLYGILGIFIGVIIGIAMIFLVKFIMPEAYSIKSALAILPLYFYGLIVGCFIFSEGYPMPDSFSFIVIATYPIPIPLLSAITGYFIAKALHPSVENLIKKREEKKKEFEREKREIIEELEKLIGDQDEKR